MAAEQLELLSDMRPKEQEIGEVERGYLDQIKKLEELGVMGAQHSGTRALVLTAARAVDQIKPTDAASGRSNLLKALNDIAQRLPEANSTTDLLSELRALVASASDTECPYDNPAP